MISARLLFTRHVRKYGSAQKKSGTGARHADEFGQFGGDGAGAGDGDGEER